MSCCFSGLQTPFSLYVHDIMIQKGLLLSMNISRRNWIQYGLAGMALTGSGVVSLSLQSTKIIIPPRELLCFSIEEYSILYAIADIILPSNPPFQSASTYDVALGVDEVFGKAHPTDLKEFKEALWIFENASIGMLLVGNTQPFTQSTTEQKKRVLEDWRTSSVTLRRKAFRAINSICQATYYSNEPTHKKMGYDGPNPALIEQVQQLSRSTTPTTSLNYQVESNIQLLFSFYIMTR